MAGIIDEIRRLAAEAADEKHELPGMVSLAYNHPGVLAYQIKTQPHYQQDMRRANWLGKVADLQDKYRAEGRGLEFKDALSPQFLGALDRRQEIASPYWNRGVMAYGQPLREGLNWAGSMPATVFNAGRMAAGVEGADEDFADAADLFSGRMLGLAVGRENPTQAAWEAERRAEESRPITDLSPFAEKSNGARILPRIGSLAYEQAASRGQTTGDQVIGEALGVPKETPAGWPRRLAGAGLESMVDPVSGIRSGIRALIGRNLPRAAVDIGSEMALPGAFIAAQEGLRHQASQWARERGMARY